MLRGGLAEDITGDGEAEGDDNIIREFDVLISREDAWEKEPEGFAARKLPRDEMRIDWRSAGVVERAGDPGRER
jgi:hypothetical protein